MARDGIRFDGRAVPLHALEEPDRLEEVEAVRLVEERAD